eukprot:TRINITY_DN3660_c1_g1_i1.p1 TRINITY_DN3660_c1_g1~~TRINITY_DN3660_c1_g1_i1.p1  ORF type:complete len:735 (-),score=161.89 TRINITY_DN3660_c1_g1_i1:306-2510(-)
MNKVWSDLDSSIVAFFNPLATKPEVRAPVRNNWPLHRLDHACIVAAIYVTFVVTCKLLLDKRKKGEASAAAGEKKEKVSVAEKIKKDGIVTFASMVIYNATQVILCAWMVYAAIAEHRRRGFSLVCNPSNLAEDGMAFVLHIFYLSKVLDFADTVFMIVKNNWRQVSFLHVYHHTSIFLLYWLNTNVNTDGDIYFTIVLNGGIHFIMYGYYLASTFNVAVPVFIKKSITNAQLVQFCCMELQGAYLLCNSCPAPSRITVLYMLYISTMLALFMDFKRRTYSQKPKKPLAKEASVGELSTAASSNDVAAADSNSSGDEKVLTIKPTEIYIDGKFYDVANFKHPGGSVMKFFVGTGDATASFKNFHMRSRKAEKILASLPHRDCPASAAPAIVGEKAAMEKDFNQLFEDLKKDGFFEPHMGEIVYRISELLALFAVGFYFFLGYSNWAVKFLGLLFLGLAEGRCGWLMHEGGHGSLTGDIKTDRNLQVIIYGLGCGMSGGWWRSNHNRHHATPQKLKHDADLETLPLVAFNEACVRGIKSPVLRSWLQAQAYLFMPLTCLLVVLGWQLFLHPRYMVRTNKYSELATLAARYYLTFGVALSGYSWPVAIACYVLVQQLAGCYIFTNFALSHTHLDVVQADEHIHWVEYSSKETVNLSNHWFVNWWMAYLNFQIEHHMFPTMPQFRHPETSKRVRSLFEKHGLKYDVRGYFACLGDTLKNLDNVGQAALAGGAEKKTK